ncbi:dTDP-4-dehydrorhamnose 3,5-epimerase [Anoxybacillus flavithermus]|uniref:dTDP-4-dehydrorhamnose 3,5-epimerase n=1 Tax=Anoxybacillus flavithermus TaxID=33934 RepID=UPI0018674270|nr:dTDP-4-dehydrorhamnose 3,5-epimerase [Anoxybacillus flavithermus]MBE2940082.1 dTDP-4-dehydrorhamnose 3,5-epimerase [Anoxybacillus flavithermus]MBE2942835.1 dTDP-4-dehydrorhamnose 3,5-epimerase [Anoxybacillus flavithermus]MBE2951179.1 dTDP-4-dehydrorhamnose 3,5-epimerase [Anoxybacillus flavithermus]MBE2953823.1 dTDP-4-dehydrorhamnose 3,5-epimerase [Anoxybacillus flavithermus]MBE2959066.1 dTDP-4-dehydrorhamnose 3,5-epimerase [Anoxybacillus flavithermus]
MKIIETRFKDAFVIEPKVFGDRRGFFMESYNDKVFKELGLDYQFIQDNHSLSVEVGTLRGLHYQLEPYAQTKLVRVIRGAIYDVIVDIRKGSPTYGEWQGFILSEGNKRQLLVPKGFAHGFCTIVPNTEVLYKVDNYYSPEHDRGICWNDPDLNIDWPTHSPILSEKDSKHPRLAEAENNFTY